MQSSCLQKQSNPTLLSDVQKLIQSKDGNEVLWAIDQLPLSSIHNSEKTAIYCFVYLEKNLRLSDKDRMNALLGALVRESQFPNLTEQERVHTVIPIITASIIGEANGPWLQLLRKECRMIHDDLVQSVAFEQVGSLLDEHTYFATESAVQMICGLCESGATLPSGMITNMLHRPSILEQCLTPFLTSIQEAYPATMFNNVVDTVMRSSVCAATMLNTIFEMKTVPDKLWQHGNDLIKRNPNNQDVISVIMKHYRVVIKNDVMNSEKFQDLVLRAPVFKAGFEEIVTKVFEETIAQFPDDKADIFYERVLSANFTTSVRLTRAFLKTKRPVKSIQKAVDYLLHPSAFLQFDEWIRTFKDCINNVTGDQANMLTEALMSYASKEISEGHSIAKPKSKEISDEMIAVRQPKTPIQVRGHRQIAAMFNAIAESPATWLIRGPCISLMKRAAEVHNAPLIPSIGALLHRIVNYTDIVCEFLVWLSKGNASKQMMMLKLIPVVLGDINKMDFARKVGTIVTDMATRSTISTVRCAAFRLLPGFMKLGKTFFDSGLYHRAVIAYHQADLENEREIAEILEESRPDFEKMEKARPSFIKPKGKENQSENCNIAQVVLEKTKPKRQSLVPKPGRKTSMTRNIVKPAARKGSLGCGSALDRLIYLA